MKEEKENVIDLDKVIDEIEREKEKDIDIIGKNVGENPKFEVLNHSLENMQKRIDENGSTLDALRFNGDLTMWIDDDGLLKESPLNMITYANGEQVHHIVGNVFFTSVDSEGDTIGLTKMQKMAVINSFDIIGESKQKEGNYTFLYRFDVDKLNFLLEQLEE